MVVGPLLILLSGLNDEFKGKRAHARAYALYVRRDEKDFCIYDLRLRIWGLGIFAIGYFWIGCYVAAYSKVRAVFRGCYFCPCRGRTRQHQPINEDNRYYQGVVRALNFGFVLCSWLIAHSSVWP